MVDDTVVSLVGMLVTPTNVRVGQRVTYSPHSDRYPATVVAVSPTRARVIVRMDDARCIDPDIQEGGFAPVHGPNQRWECFENPDGAQAVFTRRKARMRKPDGSPGTVQIEVYRPLRASTNSPPLRHGWSYYRDPNF